MTKIATHLQPVVNDDGDFAGYKRTDTGAENLVPRTQTNADGSTSLILPGKSIYVGDISMARRAAATAVATLLVGLGSATASGSNGGALSATSSAFNPSQSASGKCIYLPYNASRAYVDITTSIVMGNSLKRLGMWIYKGGTAPVTALKLYFTGDNFANFSTINIAVYPGLHFYTVPLTNGDGVVANPLITGGGTGMPFGGTCTKIRIKDDNSATGVATPMMSSGDAIEIGDIFSVGAQKAKFIIGHDDGKYDLIVPGGAVATGGDGVSKLHSYLSFVASYGWRTTVYAIGGGVGNTALGYLTANQLRAARDDWGAIICSHSYSHPAAADVASAATNAGLRLLGPHGYALTAGAAFTCNTTGLSVTPTNDYTAILNDIQTGAEKLRKMGFPTAEQHFATPQGGYDLYVNQALDYLGYKTIRGTVDQLAPIYGAYTTTGISGYELYNPDNNLFSGIQTDSAAISDAAITAYVDMLITVGGVGTNYAHSWAGSATARAKTKLLLDYLKVKSDAGLIDVVTVEDL